MTPLQQLIAAFRDLLAERRGATPAQIENLRQLALHVIDHDATSDTREQLRAALDTTNRPDARSWATDAGFGASRRG